VSLPACGTSAPSGERLRIPVQCVGTPRTESALQAHCVTAFAGQAMVDGGLDGLALPPIAA
jgi:hypothetical protein